MANKKLSRQLISIVVIVVTAMVASGGSLLTTKDVLSLTIEPAGSATALTSPVEGPLNIAELLERLNVRSQDRCDPRITKAVDLSGRYNALVYTTRGNATGKPVVLEIERNSWKVESAGQSLGGGTITATNTCNYTSVFLKIDSLAGEPELTESAISMEARMVGNAPATKNNITSLRATAPIVLATTRDKSGAFVGADIAIVVCPDYPDCLKYPKCPCPDPDK